MQTSTTDFITTVLLGLRHDKSRAEFGRILVSRLRDAFKTAEQMDRPSEWVLLLTDLIAKTELHAGL
jgi:hypothetical protein